MYVPKNLDNDNAKFVLENVILEGSNNNVFYKDKLINYQDYYKEIIAGFSNVMDFFLVNKEEYLNLIEGMENNTIRIRTHMLNFWSLLNTQTV